jgi:hypothetical protein
MTTKTIFKKSNSTLVLGQAFGARVRLLLSISLFALLIPATASALTTLSQGYTSADTIPIGSIVSLQKNFSDQVIITTTASVNDIIGVIVNSNNTLLSLSSGQTNQVQVATSGVVQVLVSDINGKITQGDSITASPINGVGMKATDNTKIVGVAQDNMSSNTSQQSYKDKAGKVHTLLIGEVPVLVNVSYFYKTPDKTVIPASIQYVANALAGKPVNSLPVIISIGIFIITLIVVSSIVYSMIHSSIISVGRNPMSQSAIYRQLIQMSALVLGILVVAVISIYMVLQKF